MSIVCRSDLERGESPAGRSLVVFGYRGALPRVSALPEEGEGREGEGSSFEGRGGFLCHANTGNKLSPPQPHVIHSR